MSSPVKWEDYKYCDKQFPDVPTNSPYAGNISFLSNAALISGYPDGSIRPMDNITRLEAGCLLGNLFQLKEYTINRPDVPYLARGIQTVLSKGIMTG